MLCENECTFRMSRGGPNVSRFSSHMNSQIVQGRRGRFPERVYVVRFLGTCVGSEEIAKND